MIRRLFFINLIVLGVGFTPVAAQNDQTTPRFGDGIALLSQSFMLLPEPAISAYGNYVFTRFYRNTEHVTEPRILTSQVTDHYLWDLDELMLTAGLMDLTPTASLFPGEALLATDYAFSPTDALLALRVDAAVNLYEVPSLDLVTTIPMTAPIPELYAVATQFVIWSFDGRFVATLDGNDLVAWEWENNTLYRYSLPLEYSYIGVTETGWILDQRYQEQHQSFVVCTEQLESCQTYEFPEYHQGVVFSLNGQKIIAQSGSISGDRTLRVWDQTQLGSYEVYDLENIPDEFETPGLFNQDGHRLLAVTSTQGYARRYWGIWDIPELNLVYLIPDETVQPAWLPSENYLVSFDIWGASAPNSELTLRLYSTEDQALVDELILNEVEGFENIRSWLEGSNLLRQGVRVTDDGEWVILNLGWMLIAVPIVYS